MKLVKPVINLKARGGSSTKTFRSHLSHTKGLLAHKQNHRQDFYQRELKRQLALRQKLERAKNAGVDSVAKPAVDAKTKQVEQTIGFLQKKV